MLSNVIIVEDKGKLTIKQVSNSVTNRIAYMSAVQEYILKGYRLPLEPNNWDAPMGNVRGLKSLVTLYAEGKDPSLKKPKVEPKVEPEAKAEPEPEAADVELSPQADSEPKVEDTPVAEETPKEPESKKKGSSKNKK